MWTITLTTITKLEREVTQFNQHPQDQTTQERRDGNRNSVGCVVRRH